MSLSPETLAWLRQTAKLEGSVTAQVLLHLLERVEALEQRPTCADSAQVPPTPEAAPVATDNGLLRCYAQAIEDAVERGGSRDEATKAGRRAIFNLGRQHGAAQLPAPHPAPPVAPISDSKMAAYNRRAADRFAILDRLEKVIDFNSHGWRLTSEGEQWQQLVDEQGQDECEMGL